MSTADTPAGLWVSVADRARIIGTLTLAAYCYGRLIVWLTPWPNVVPPLDLVEAALPPLVWIMLWGTAGTACIAGATSLRAYRAGTGMAGVLLFVWGVSYAAAAIADHALVMPALMHLTLASMVLVNGSLSSMLPSRLSIRAA